MSLTLKSAAPVTTNPSIKPPGLRVILIVSAIALAFTGLSFWLLTTNPFGSKPQPTETSSQKGGKQPTGGIGALGRLEPEGEVFRIAPPATGFNARVAQVLVQEGAKVKAGQPLAVMDSYDALRAAGLAAEAKVREAQARLAQVKAGAKVGDVNAQRAAVLQARTELRRAQAEESSARLELNKVLAAAREVEAEYIKAQADLKRYQSLAKAGAISQSELEDRQLEMITKKQQLEQGKQTIQQAQRLVEQRAAASNRAELEIAEAQQRLSSVAEVRPTDVQQAEAQVQTALAEVRKAKADFDNAVVKSPIYGQVLKVYAKSNELVDNAKGLMELGRTDQMYVVAEVDESLVGRVREGQFATVSSDAFPGDLTGRVVQVGRKVGTNDITSTDPADSQDLRVVEVKIKLDDSAVVAGLTNLQVRVAIQP